MVVDKGEEIHDSVFSKFLVELTFGRCYCGCSSRDSTGLY
jgi:hypothetical protein